MNEFVEGVHGRFPSEFLYINEVVMKVIHVLDHERATPWVNNLTSEFVNAFMSEFMNIPMSEC